jgi:hypothetical protein
MRKITLKEFIEKLPMDERDAFAKDVGYASGWRSFRHVVYGRRGTPLSKAKKIVSRSGGRIDIYSLCQE